MPMMTKQEFEKTSAELAPKKRLMVLKAMSHELGERGGTVPGEGEGSLLFKGATPEYLNQAIETAKKLVPHAERTSERDRYDRLSSGWAKARAAESVGRELRDGLRAPAGSTKHKDARKFLKDDVGMTDAGVDGAVERAKNPGISGEDLTGHLRAAMEIEDPWGLFGRELDKAVERQVLVDSEKLERRGAEMKAGLTADPESAEHKAAREFLSEKVGMSDEGIAHCIQTVGFLDTTPAETLETIRSTIAGEKPNGPWVKPVQEPGKTAAAPEPPKDDAVVRGQDQKPGGGRDNAGADRADAARGSALRRKAPQWHPG